jgi:putative endonuclease
MSLNPNSSRNWSVYLVECSDGSYYCGISNCLERRIQTHNKGRGARYTKTRLPVRLITSKGGMGQGVALRFERRIKTLPRANKISALANNPEGSIVVWDERN